MGFADIYEKYRPTPPAIIADLLLQLTGMERADHVVDLDILHGALGRSNTHEKFPGITSTVF